MPLQPFPITVPATQTPTSPPSGGKPLPAHLAFLRERLRPVSPPTGTLPLGDARLDACLPRGGLPLGALHEVAAQGMEVETGAIAAGFIALLLARLPSRRPILWAARRDDLHPPGLPHLDPARLILLRAPDDAAVLGAIETALRAGGLAAVVGEVGAWGRRGARIASRRLHLACQERGIPCFALRRWPHGGQQADREASAAATRWCLAPAPSTPAAGELGPRRWTVTLEQARGGRPGAWLVEVNDDRTPTTPPALRVVAPLADHAAAPARPPRQAAGHG